MAEASRENLTSQMLAELASDEVTPILLVKFEFDSGDVLFWNGIGNITYNGDTYVGAGGLDTGISSTTETLDVTPESMTFYLSGIPSTNISLALSETYQQRPVTMFLGLSSGFDSSRDLDTNYAITAFKGKMDQMEIEEDGGYSRISIRAENDLVVLQRPNIRRWTSEDQKSNYPNDKGFYFVPFIQDLEVTWK